MAWFSGFMLKNSLKALIEPRRYYSVKDISKKFGELLEAREGEYFNKKTHEFLDYVRKELHNGRPIDEIIEDLKKLESERHKHELEIEKLKRDSQDSDE